MRLGQRMKQLREEQKLTVERLAKRLRCSPSVLEGYEADRDQPSLLQLHRVANLIGCDLLDFFVQPGRDARHDVTEMTRRMTRAQIERVKRVARAANERRR